MQRSCVIRYLDTPDHAQKLIATYYQFQPLRPTKLFLKWIFNKLMWIVAQTRIHYLWLPSWAEGMAYTSDSDDDSYTDDYGTDDDNPYYSYGGTDELNPDTKEETTGQEGQDPIDSSVPEPEPQPEETFPTNVKTPPPAKYVPSNSTVPRPCEKKVYLYNLQPERLNTSGMSNPLKGKLTNCHASGCERYDFVLSGRMK